MATLKDKMSELIEKFIKQSKPLPPAGQAQKEMVERAKAESERIKREKGR